jgi:hypothetical protein
MLKPSARAVRAGRERSAIDRVEGDADGAGDRRAMVASGPQASRVMESSACAQSGVSAPLCTSLSLTCIYVGKQAVRRGGRGIRTREAVARLHALQACPFVRSGRPPRRV